MHIEIRFALRPRGDLPRRFRHLHKSARPIPEESNQQRIDKRGVKHSKHGGGLMPKARKHRVDNQGEQAKTGPEEQEANRLRDLLTSLPFILDGIIR